MQTHAQISGQGPPQTGSQLSAMTQPNSNSIPSQMQTLGGLHTAYNMGTEENIRQRMREKIYKLLQHRKQITPEMLPRLDGMSRRLEEVLFKNATTMEDYTNMNTLEHRLYTYIRHSSATQRHQVPHSATSPSSIGTMIPTPGMAHRGNFKSTISTSMDNSVIVAPISSSSVGAADNMKARSLLSTPNGSTGGVVYRNSFDSSEGPTCLQRTASQMIPTPGMSNLSANPEPLNNAGLLSGTTILPKLQQRKQYIGGHNSLQNVGGQMDNGLRSSLSQKSLSSGFPNSSANCGLGLTGNNVHLMHNTMVSGGHLTASSYGFSSPSPRHSTSFDPLHQEHLMQTAFSQQMDTKIDDGYGLNTVDLSGPEYGSGTTVGPAVNNQNLSQAVHTKPQTTDQISKMNIQSCHASQQQIPNSQQQGLQQQPHLSQQQFVNNQQNQVPQSLLLKRDEQMQSSATTSLGSPLVTASLGSQVMDDQTVNSQNGLQYSNTSEQFRLSERQNQFQQTTSAEDRSRGAHILWNPSGPEEPCSSLSQNSGRPVVNQQHLLVESHDNFGNVASDSKALLQGQCFSQSQEKFQISGQLPQEHLVQEEFRHRIKGHDEAQRPHLLSNGSITSQTLVSRLNVTPRTPCGQGNTAPGCRDQIRWLLFLLHARRCSAPEGKCLEVHCIKAQQLWKHIEGCSIDKCSYPRCHISKLLIQHNRKCRKQTCPICIPVRRYIDSHFKSPARCMFGAGFVNSIAGSRKSSDAEDAARLAVSTGKSTAEASPDLQSLVKRIKVEHPSPSLIPKNEWSPITVPATSQPNASLEAQSQVQIPMNEMFETTEAKAGFSMGTVRETPYFNEKNKIICGDVYSMKPNEDPMFPNGPDGVSGEVSMKYEKDLHVTKQETDQEMATVATEQSTGTKSGKPKIKGVSLTELFSPEEIRRHIIGLRQWVGQSKSKAEKNQAMEHSMSENSCQLCAVEKLTFEPPPIYCTLCGARIKRNAMYYTTGSGDTRNYFCIPCYNEPRGDTIEVDGNIIPKVKMEKKKNDEDTEEWWVQCDKCEAWQHQICALFNGRRNDGGEAEYTCPNCYIGEIERGERKPLPQSAVLGAKDLPRTILSDHIENRLFKRLRQERQDRARLQGKNFDEVPGAEALVVRVVSSVDKKLEVKQRFLEIFQEENYPTEFPYKSKVILLFQKIEGVEVCLFGMYVQEFGSECLFPNQRRVYLSYLDSVKYFRPEIKAVTGEALRTFVYHEILIAYLEYCKKRGFTSCYIWACPPLKGEDYILYCHPEIQKTPKSDKLREWYLAMLRKAAKENIVAELTNLYDHFFVTTGECKAKVTAARLPYFDGDYWPGAAEDMINQLIQEEDGKKQQKKGKTKKIITKRALKAAGQADLSGNASKDILLMQKLGETISPMKEDFIMVHLQHACTHCCHLMASGTRWVCSQCKKFQLCDKCYDAEQKLEERERHPINSRDKHRLHPVEVKDVPEDTKDKDDILESEFFDTRQAFLSLCQGNHYQYDTLRRAKHSSMMVLYHLHNPTAPAFVTTCNICHNDIETGQGWRCEICPDYDICNSCYQKDGGVDHPHKLTNHPSIADRDAQNKEARQLRVLQLRKMLDLLVHASQCRYPQCPYPNCRKVKGLFRHGIHCKTRATGGCVLCKKMWYILQLHARACKESECRVPRCRDLKDHLKRSQQQSDSRRRAAVMEMMRQRAAEVVGNSG